MGKPNEARYFVCRCRRRNSGLVVESRPRIGKGGIEFSVLQSYFQSYLRNPSIGHRRVAIRPCGD
jgi:hypothetical protein